MLNYSQEIEDLKSVNDRLLFMTVELQARTATLTQMILNVYRETLPEDVYKNLYTNYVNVLEENINDYFEPLSEIIADQASVLKERFELASAIQHLKKDENYVLNASIDQ